MYPGQSLLLTEGYGGRGCEVYAPSVSERPLYVRIMHNNLEAASVEHLLS